MKRKTLLLLVPHLKENKLVFNENEPTVDIYLTDNEIKELLKSEYNYAPKKEKTIHKNLTKLIDSLLTIVIESIESDPVLMKQIKEKSGN